MRFAEPWWLALGLLIPAPWLLSRLRPRVVWPTLAGFRATGRRRAALRAALPIVLRGLAVGALAVALARPQSVGGRIRIAGQGVTIVVALDQSSSMNARDPASANTPTDRPAQTRLDAARRTFLRFIEGRPDDLLGLVAFANYPDLLCPPTLDHEFLAAAVAAVRPARAGDDGTNLGAAIVWGLEALRGPGPKKRVLILVTDGRDAPAVPRPIDPRFAAGLARRLGVTLHTIAVGTPEGSQRPAPDPTPAEPTDGPDLGLLRDLAEAGGGRSFVAADPSALDHVFRAIDVLEKSPVLGTILTRYREDFPPWAVTALALLLADLALAVLWSRKIP